MSIDYKVDGKCDPSVCHSQCCASILPLSDYEINKIKKYIRRNNILAVNRNADQSVFGNEDEYVNICPFLSEDFQCNIYVHRPEICRNYLCGEDRWNFNDRDKKIIDMLSTFYPNEKCLNKPNVEMLDEMYQAKKEEIKKLKRGE